MFINCKYSILNNVIKKRLRYIKIYKKKSKVNENPWKSLVEFNVIMNKGNFH